MMNQEEIFSIEININKLADLITFGREQEGNLADQHTTRTISSPESFRLSVSECTNGQIPIYKRRDYLQLYTNILIISFLLFTFNQDMLSLATITIVSRMRRRVVYFVDSVTDIVTKKLRVTITDVFVSKDGKRESMCALENQFYRGKYYRRKGHRKKDCITTRKFFLQCIKLLVLFPYIFPLSN